MTNIYQNIAERTNGNIYIGVVGPVRTGKSTFVSQFVQKLVLPNIADENQKKRTLDELPQSADGKTIMTTQLKFVPEKAVKLNLDGEISANIRLIDCVGYLVDGAEGHMEDDKPRLVSTAWSADPMPFEQVAEIGTRKVACEHSTIAVVVTTDGSIGDLARKDYVLAEEKAISELKKSGKPFVVVLNTTKPSDESVNGLCKVLQDKYGVQIIPMDLLNCTSAQLEGILQAILQEFSVRKIDVNLPTWMRALSKDNTVIATIMAKIKDASIFVDKIKDVRKLVDGLICEYVTSCSIENVDCAKGYVSCTLTVPKELFFQVLSEQAQAPIDDEFSLMSFVTASAYAKQRFEVIRDALDEADVNGYGVVYPLLDKMTLDEPQMIKQGNVYGVRMQAKAPSYHIIRADIVTDVSPMVGSEQQSQYLLDQYKQDPQAIWNTNMFGKTMSGIARDGLIGKCARMPIEVKQKLTKTVSKIVNDNKGGLICILL